MLSVSLKVEFFFLSTSEADKEKILFVLMYFVQSVLFLWLGLAGYSPSQWANLVDATPSAPQNELNDHSGIDYDMIGNRGWDSSNPGNNSPEIPITIPGENFQACSSNKYEQPPTKRQLRREWCRDNELTPNNIPASTTNPKPPSSVQEDKPTDEESGAGQLENGEKTTPATNENPQLPSFPGRERFPGQLDSNPCNGPRINPVCSALEIRRALYPFSLVWKATWLDYCRVCTWNLLRYQKPYHAFFL